MVCCLLLLKLPIIIIPYKEPPNQCTGSIQVNEPHPYYVSWEVIGDEVTFSIFSTLVDTTRWVGIGFSLSPSMVIKHQSTSIV